MVVNPVGHMPKFIMNKNVQSLQVKRHDHKIMYMYMDFGHVLGFLGSLFCSNIILCRKRVGYMCK